MQRSFIMIGITPVCLAFVYLTSSHMMKSPMQALPLILLIILSIFHMLSMY